MLLQRHHNIRKSRDAKAFFYLLSGSELAAAHEGFSSLGRAGLTAAAGPG